MATRKEKVAKSTAEKQTRSYKMPTQGNKIDDKSIANSQLKAPTDTREIKSQGSVIDDKAIAASQLGKPADLQNMEKRLTISDMLAPARENAKKQKTDALKMQKYYALSDVFSALGKMGGAAVGGAIGGSMMDSAPAVEAYQPSRGYITAFEEAKKANERLRSLDEKEYQLTYDKQQRDNERRYNARVAAQDRAYKAELHKLDQQWQKDMIDYRSKIEQAAQENNLALKAKYEAEASAREQKYWKERAGITASNEQALKQMGLDISKWQANTYNTTPIRFGDGTNAMIPDNYYESLKNSFIGKTINGVDVDKDNVETFIRSNPELVGEYLRGWGISTSVPTTAATQAIKNHEFISAQHTEPAGVSKESESEKKKDESVKIDLGQFERK